MKLVVGLGNPGNKYQHTRHNIGFMIADQLANVNQATGWKSQFSGLVTEVWIGGLKTLILKPQTMMNRSGRSVYEAVQYYKIELLDILIVCDDFSLPLGKLRMRIKGSSGGQNGLNDIIRHMHDDEVCRLRVGIGQPDRQDPADFVLDEFKQSEHSLVEDVIIEAGRACESWVKNGPIETMNRYNGTSLAKE